MRFPLTTLAVSVALIAGCSSQGVQTVAQPSQLEFAVQQVPAPVAKKEPYALNHHGERRIDNYYWMRDDERKDAEILAHLEKKINTRIRC